MRLTAERASLGLCATVALAMCSAAPAQTAPETSLVLVRDGQPVATLVIAKDATRAAQFAAYELQWHFRKITGAEVPIVRDDAAVTGTRVLVGESAATVSQGLTNASFKSQDYLVRFLPDTLVLMGRDKDDRGEVKYNPTPSPAEIGTWPSIWDEQGTMYAAYDFLERACNVRWFNPTETGMDCPSTPTLTVTGTEIRRAPFFRYRYASYHSSENYDAYTALWPRASDGFKQWEATAFPDLHARFQDQGQYTLAKRGWVQLFRFRMRDGGELCPGNHSLYGYYDRFWEQSADPTKAKLFEGQKPDWFAKGCEGKPPQMCYASRGLIEQVAQDARDFFDGKGTKPGAVAAGNYFCVEPMDNSAFCKCPQCQALLTPPPPFDPFFSNGGHSDYFFSFVNEVAKDVRKTHPDKWIVTLAYMTHAARPQHVVLEPNVLVQFCFACNRLNFDRASYEHEIDLLNEWVAKEKQRPLYLWLYYTFPVEIANNGKFHCFPGFFAHAVGEQFKLFQKCGIGGMFHCGYGQEVEAYLTYKLMDDPARDVDALLDEYFTRLYGSAAAPMKQLYLAIEETYSNPLNYPESVASRSIEGHHHQTEEVAWGYLGTEPRMAAFGKLLQAAKDSAKTETAKQRVALFEKSTWDYMVAGRQLYMEHTKAKYGGIGAPLRVPFASGTALNGDATKLVRDETAVLFGWRSHMGERTRRNVEARLLTDDTHLYVQLEEKIAPETLKSSDDVLAGDCWTLTLAAKRQRPYRELAVGPTGKIACREFGADASAAPTPCDIGAVVVSDVAGKDRWTVSLALPLEKLLPGGVASGGTFCLNLARRAPDRGDEPVWIPTFAEFSDPTRLRELTLDTAGSIPFGVPTEADLSALATQDLVGLWRLNDGTGTAANDASPNGLKGTLANGASWVDDKGRPVVRLDDRRGQHVELGNADALNLTGPLTLEIWVKYELSEVSYPAVFGKGYEATGAYSLHLRPGLTPWFELDGEDGVRNIYNPTDMSLAPGVWTHVVATYDGAMMRVFLNGREAGGGKEAKLKVRKTAEPLRIGWLGSYGYFNGCVRDAAIYSRAMSAGEVFARYKAGR
ncbi:MAG: hypothetical protein A3K18_10940 [Lentisphaerae bacterium RIFOXYA12_64_32]|nr:MAG: hypothetical protein A3K18_10940 [Lentisphaerae bacterium RIFOXYA12_64_32]